MSLKHFETTLKKFKFTESQIKKIKSLKRKFCRIFEDNIKEITETKANIPQGFKNNIGFNLEDDKLQHRNQSNSIHGFGNNSIMHKDFWERDMIQVGIRDSLINS